MAKKGDDVAYVRVSTMKLSQQDSPEHQEAFIRESAAREGTTISEVYLDRDTGTNIVARVDVQRLINDAQKGKIRSVWFASLSRFTRDAIDGLSLKRIIVNVLRIRLVSIEDNYDSAVKDDELLFGIKTFVNQNTSGDISQSSKRGIRASALEKGNIIATRAAFGYKKVTIGKRKTYEIDLEKAPIVQMIYNLYINGLGDKGIVNYLNGDNPSRIVYPSPTGKEWGLSSVQSILDNPIYTGYNVSGRYKSEVAYDDITDLMNRRKKLVKTPRSEWEYSKEQTHPEIVTKEIYDLSQEIRLGRGGGARGGRRSFVNVFAKMIFCSECGSAMVTMKAKSRDGGKEYRYLMCSRRRRVGETGCSNGKWIPYYDFRDEIMDEILKRVSRSIERFKSAGAEEVEFSFPNNNYQKEMSKLEKANENNRKLLFEIRRQHMLGELESDQYDFEKKQYEAEIEQVQNRLAIIQREQQKVLDKERLYKESLRVLNELTSIASYNDDVDKTRALLAQVVRKITVGANGEVEVQTYV